MSNPTILLLALLIDAAVGDPEWLYRAIAHPTVLAGRLIDWLDQSLNNLADSPAWQRFWGIVAMVFLVGGGLTVGWLIEALLSYLPLDTHVRHSQWRVVLVVGKTNVRQLRFRWR